jgi:signal transduction histidine kinase
MWGPLLSSRDRTRLNMLFGLGAGAFILVLGRLALFDFAPRSNLFHPHGFCYLWQSDLVTLHVVSDMLIGTSYVAISLTLVYLVFRARKHLPFSWIFIAFGAFIVACGATHFMEVWTLWSPVFWLAADVKIITAVASVATAIVLPPLIPKAIALVEEAAVSDTRRLALEAAHAELELRVEMRTRELREALDRAEEANRSKEAFLGIVSHELRTPLNAILGWSRMLNRSTPDAGFLKRGLTVIDRNARAQAQLIEDLLDMSRISSGNMRLQLEPADLRVVVSDALDVVGPAAESRQVSIAVDLPESPVVLMMDPRRVQQIAWNLLSNAVKFTPAGGRVAVHVGRESSTAVLRVEDNGVGIAPAFLPRLFERFSQADESSERHQQGIGLGLAISKHLAQLHGGTIRVTSAGPGQGATFTVELPVALGAVRADRDRSRGRRFDDARLDGVRVLIVDDQVDALDLYEAILGEAGAVVSAVSSADAAIDLLRAQSFDVMISDLAMPGRDGFSLIDQVRREFSGTPGAPIAIALSAYAGAADRDRALAAGYLLYLAKPIAPEALVHGISSALAL